MNLDVRKLSRLYPSLLIIALCIVGMFKDVTFYNGCPWWHCFVYHFSHANIFHLAMNIWGLLAFKPRWSTCAVAYIVATLSAFVPFVSMDVGTCGLSGFLMAAYARNYATYQMSVAKPLLVNFVFVFFPMVNWKIHIITFLASHLIWYCKRT